MHSDPALKPMAVRQFTGLVEARHIRHQGGAGDYIFVERFYDCLVDFRTDSEVVGVYYDLPGFAGIEHLHLEIAALSASMLAASFCTSSGKASALRSTCSSRLARRVKS